MASRATITLDDDVFDFLKSRGETNRSAFINKVLREERQRSLSVDILKANLEESSDTEYQDELDLWNATLSDGLPS